ncbi:MAG: AlpA family phage regulatory protein [Synergistaceae bacterium]|jgi:predicted DNA-binding transcriptional regulator AlpA|nr:AlpA family phage regulatory protein [Synergistaceae bacterium]
MELKSKETTLGFDRMLKDYEVAEKLGCCKSTVWVWLKGNPAFPQPIRTGPKSTRFRESEVDEYLESRKGVE